MSPRSLDISTAVKISIDSLLSEEVEDDVNILDMGDNETTISTVPAARQ